MSAWLWVLAGPFIGSFLGVLIRRLPQGQGVAFGRSVCGHCGAPLGARDLVPLASFAALRGRCRHCGAAIGSFHPAIELAAIAVALSAVAAEPDPTRTGWDCALGWTLLTLAWMDWEECWLPDVLTLPLILGGLVEAVLATPWTMAERAEGALAGWFGLLALGWAYRRLRGREGLGDGDAKLLGAAGAWLGWAALPWVLLTASVLALAWAAVSAWRGRAMTAAAAVPFGPWLALGIWVWRLVGGD